MYSEKLESLISDIIADGEIEEAEMNVLKKAAIREGEDPEELEIVIKGRLAKMKKQEAEKAAPPMPNAPQSDKFGGTAMRCPACGALYVVGTAACPECGYAFSGIKATSSAEKLYQALLEFNEKNKVVVDNSSQPTTNVGAFFGSMGLDKSSAKKFMNLGDDGEADVARRKMNVIQDFPVPNSREDLIDFLTSIQPKADPSAPKRGMTGSGIPGVYNFKERREDLGYAYWLLYANCINKARMAFANDPDFAPFFAFYDAKNAGNATKSSEGKGGLFGKFFKK